MTRRAAAVVILLSLGAAGGAAAEIVDRVLAVAAGKIIMLSDVRAAADLGLVDPGAAPDRDRAILNRLIERALVLDEVDRYAPPEPADESVDSAVRTVRARFTSDVAFADALARDGLTERELRETLREDLRLQAYLDQRFAADTAEHSREMVEEWVNGLRRRADIIDLYDKK